jgi:hypothetical protein
MVRIKPIGYPGAPAFSDAPILGLRSLQRSRGKVIGKSLSMNASMVDVAMAKSWFKEINTFYSRWDEMRSDF